MADNQKFFPKVFGGLKNLLGVAITTQYPELGDIYNQYMSRDSKNKGSITGDTKGYVGPTGFDPNYFNQNAINFDTDTNTEDVVDTTVSNQKEAWEGKLNVTDLVEAVSKGEDVTKSSGKYYGSGRKDLSLLDELSEEHNLPYEKEDPINNMLEYAMMNRFYNLSGPKPNRYQVPMMKTAQRGLKY